MTDPLDAAAELTRALLPPQVRLLGWDVDEVTRHHAAIVAAVVSAGTAHDLDVAQLWNHLANHPDPRLATIAALAGPAQHLEALTHHTSPRVRLAVTYNHAATPGLLRTASTKMSASMGFALAAHPNTPSEVLAEVAWYADHLISDQPVDVAGRTLRDVIATHPRCPVELRDPAAH